MSVTSAKFFGLARVLGSKSTLAALKSEDDNLHLKRPSVICKYSTQLLASHAAGRIYGLLWLSTWAGISSVTPPRLSSAHVLRDGLFLRKACPPPHLSACPMALTAMR
eukprot:1584228-Amphidinium_carterae.1